MSLYRVPRHDIQLITEAASYGAEWRGRIPVPISWISDDPGFALHAAFQSMQVGDEIQVSAFDPEAGAGWRDGYGVIREQARFLCTEKTTKLILQMVGDVLEFAAPREIETPEGVTPLDIVPHKEGGQTVYRVRDRAGNEIEAFVEEQQAIDFRDRAQGVPGIVGYTVRKGFGKFMVCDEQGAIAAEFTSLKEADAWAMCGGQKAA